MKNKILIVDGYNFLFRAYFAMNKFTRADGTPVGAVYGFVNMILNLRKKLHCTHFLLTFDTGKKTFRNDIYKDYKANRPPVPEDLIPQFSLVRQAAKSMGILVLEKDGYEADDIIATVSKRAEKQGYDVLIASSDKDLMQLINDNIVLYDGMKQKEIGEHEIKEKFDIKPTQILDLLAMTGDTADNVPGIPGIGPKTAAELINKYGDLETVLKHTDEITQNKRRQVLEENKERALLSKKLIKLNHEVPLDKTLKDMELTKIEHETFIPFLEEQQFESIKKRFINANGDIDNGHSTVKKRTKSPEIEYKKITNLDELDDIITQATWKGLIFAHLDANALVLSPQKRYIYYIPLKNKKQAIEHDDLFVPSTKEKIGGFEFADVAKKLAELFEDKSVTKIGCDIKGLIKAFVGKNIEMSPFHDIQVMSYILDAGKYKHELSNIIRFNLLGNIDEDEWYLKTDDKKLNLKEKMDILEKLEKGNKIDDYNTVHFELACFKIEAIGYLYELLKQRLLNENMSSIYERFERPLTRVLVDMEMNGISINLTKLKELSEDFEKKIRKTENEIYKLAGEEFNIGSPKQLGEILFDKMKLDGGKKTSKSGQFSTDSRILEELGLAGHEIAEKVLEWRHFSKLKSTYTDALQKQIDPKTHRVHTSFSNVNTATGRLSSNNPNLQNIPIRSEEGEQIRETFEAKKGYKLISADYSQVELRVLSHYANVKSLIQAFKDGKDIHAITGSQIFGVPESEIKKDLRRKAKAINFGIVYGISPFGLARNIKVSQDEAAKYIKAYFEKYPEIKQYMDESKKFAKEHGFVKTLFGRKCYINQNASKFEKGFAERLAINAPMQGTAADIIKKAMIDLYNELKDKKLDAKILLQVHDELIVEAKTEIADKVAKILVDRMEKAIVLSTPLKVDVGIGKNWKEIH